MFKSIVDPAEGLIVNDQVTADSWNLANNNTDRTISLPKNMKAIVKDIVKILIESNNEEIPVPILGDKKPEIKHSIKEEKKISLNNILMDDSPEDMYIEDNFIGDMKPEKIEEKEKIMSFNLKRKIDTENEDDPKNILLQKINKAMTIHNAILTQPKLMTYLTTKLNF